MAKGGKRKGAGRPKGSTNRPSFLSYFKKRDITAAVKFAKQRMGSSDRVLVEVLQQIFGKAPSTVDLTSGGKPLLIASDNET